MAYLDGNKQLAIDCSNLIDMLKQIVQEELSINFATIGNIPIPAPNDGNEDEDVSAWSSSVAMLNEMSQRGYECLRRKLMKDFKLTKKDIPSFYHMTKNSPGFEPVSLTLAKLPDFMYFEEDLENSSPIDEMQQKDEIVISRRLAECKDANEYDVDAILGLGEDTIEGAKIAGTYTDYLNLMLRKHQSQNKALEGKVLVVDSYDGAEHSKNEEGRVNVLSYSTQMFTNKSLFQGFSSSSSFNILTWLQMLGEEKPSFIFPVIEQHYEEKHKIRSSGETIENSSPCFYDCHDGKMLYILTQHSLWNRKHNPFLLCNCSRGDAVKDGVHQCEFIDHHKQVEFYERSAKRFRLARQKHGEKYNRSVHMDWIDEKNSGISHFGIHPDKLRCDGIRFDTFHLRCAITRLVMNYFRRFMRAQSCETMSSFTELLSTEWGPYLILIWNCNKALSSVKGNEISKFIALIPQVENYLKNTFIQTE